MHNPSQGQIDPRLYSSNAVPLSHSGPPPHYVSSNPRLPPIEGIDQSHQLPPLSNNAPLQQPYYRLPAATPLQQQQQQQRVVPPPTANHDQESARYSTQNARQSTHSRESSPTIHTDLNGDPNDPKRSRACEACRGLKVRCDRDENDPSKPCKRCAKARRNCIITAPSRKRQKKTDSRVAELEKKIDALTADLRKQKHDTSTSSPNYGRDGGPLSPPQSNYSMSTAAAATPPTHQGSEPWQRDLEDRTHARRAHPSSPDRLKKRQLDRPDVETHMLHHRPRSSRTDDSDSATSSGSTLELPFDGIVDIETSTRIFDRYVAEMAQHLPAVMFESDTTAAEIRTNRPTLFLAILDVASVGMLDIEVQQRLNEMLLDVFANSILRQGEKSLDLVQALMVATIWYRPPRRYEQMNVYMLTHIAALMALDFGMGRKLNASRNMRVAANVGQNSAPKTFLRSDSVEARRTWLGCYFVCMNVSLSLRRPSFIRWNSYLDECVKVLESAPETLPSDKRLCQHVRLMHINEEIGVRFSMDDPSATIAISDPRVQFAIGAFEKRLDEWVNSVPKGQWDQSLEFSKHFSRLYMHEIAIHNNHNIDDFRAPFTEESLKAPSLQAKALTPYHNGLLQQCLASVHEMFRAFAAFDLVTVKALPIFYFVRIAYAVVVLIKLHAAVSDPKSDLLFREEDLHVEYHLDRLLQVFQRIASEDAFRPARMFMIIVSKLRDGFKSSHSGSGKSRVPPATPQLALEAGLPSRSPSTSKESKSKHRKQSASPSLTSTSAPEKRQMSQSSQGSTPGQMQSIQESQVQMQQQGAMLRAVQQQHLEQQQNSLQLLSEVATNNAQQNMLSGYGQSQQQQWFQQAMHPHSSMFMDFGQGMDPAFEQAVDMTMSIGDGDLSSLFMEEGNYGFAPGMIPEGHLSFQNVNENNAWNSGFGDSGGR